MEHQMVIDIMTHAFRTSLVLAGPALGFALVIGILVSIFQTVTSINEQTLVFVPKMVGVGVAILFFFSWMLAVCVKFCEDMFALIPVLAH